MTSNDSGNDLRERFARTGFATILLIGLMAMALVGAGCGGDDNAGTGEDSGATAAQTESTGEKADDKAASSEGKEKFVSTCGGCHTLADAGTSGTTGPDLDDLKPDQARVEAAIKNGGASGTTMPKNLLEGEDATQVAEYVSSVAGK